MADGGKTYSAKQVATRIGTEAKQLRKFFRDPNSGYDAVGQGGRYDFPEEEVTKIKIAFDSWNATKTRRNRPSQSSDPKPASAAGLIPGQRKDSPAAPRTPRMTPARLAREGLHGNALDDDTLQERHAGIGARAKKHNLVIKNGRFVPGPKLAEGLTPPPEPEVLDFTDVDDEAEQINSQFTKEKFDQLWEEIVQED